ncbi:MAG TPA: glycosyltransferase family 4 protein [Vicinamibacterales bacterium]|nr:glycosyltransferase family 4 protein [Vicinamibacterales bacterium]
MAQLPVCLGLCSVEAGDEVGFLTYGAPGEEPRRPAHALPGRVVHVPAPGAEGGVRVGAVLSSLIRGVLPSIRHADVVHVHGGSLIARAGALAASLARRPVVLTLYGGEIWEYRRRRSGVDLFTRAYRTAAHVVFFSQGLLTHAMQLGLGRRESSVIYPPVLSVFEYHDEAAQLQAREALGIRNRHVLVTVKRVDAYGGHRTLLEALSELIRTHPDTRLVICGTGPLLPDARDAARSWGVEGHVTFTGALAPEAVARYDAAADVFVLPSLLDSCPPGALEALASGTPVIAADNPGGLELRELFGFDVSVVPRGNALGLARTLVHFLEDRRRVRPATYDLLNREFRPAHVGAQYRAIYARAVERAAARTSGHV